MICTNVAHLEQSAMVHCINYELNETYIMHLILGNLITCKYRDREHKNGEVIYLDDYCVKCICQNGFSLDDSSTETRCARLRCGLELRHADKIEKYCAPAYVATAFPKMCCPNAFICRK